MKTNPRTFRDGFTLIELTVVISVIVLAMAIALPTMLAMFSAGADKQAENVFTSLCTAARTVAIRDGRYTCVHGQMGYSNVVSGKETSKVAGTFYLAICWMDANTGKFSLTPGFDPQRLPGDMAMGAVSTYSVSGTGNYNQAVVDYPDKFACFNIIFSPAGRLVSLVNDLPIQFNTADLAFSTTDANLRLWDATVANSTNVGVGVAAVTLFPYGQYLARTGAGEKTAYINVNGQFLPINYYTGQMFPRR